MTSEQQPPAIDDAPGPTGSVRGRLLDAPMLNPDVLRLSFVSLAMTPMLLKNVFEEPMERRMNAAFLERLAHFNGHQIAAGLATLAAQSPEKNP